MKENVEESVMKLIDADVLIDYHNKHEDAIEYLENQPDWRLIGISVLTKLEVLEGARNKADVRAIKKFFSVFGEIFPSEASCRISLQLFERYHLSNGIDPYDAMLAGICLTKGFKLVSRNEKHYTFVPNLKLEISY